MQQARPGSNLRTRGARPIGPANFGISELIAPVSAQALLRPSAGRPVGGSTRPTTPRSLTLLETAGSLYTQQRRPQAMHRSQGFQLTSDVVAR